MSHINAVRMQKVKRARTISDRQAKIILAYFEKTNHPDRNRVIFMLSLKLGLRAIEIAGLCWYHVLNNEQDAIDEKIHLTDDITKKGSGREFYMGNEVREALWDLYTSYQYKPFPHDRVVLTQSRVPFTRNGISVLFHRWFTQIFMWEGYSSHSGRRSYITKMAQVSALCGGSLREVQKMAGHKWLTTTQLYIEENPEAQKKMANMA